MKTANLLFLVPTLLLSSINSTDVNFIKYEPNNFNVSNVSSSYMEKDGAHAASFQSVDAAVDELIPLNHVYTFNEAVDLRKSLERDLKNNSNSLVLNWALIRFYACAPSLVGGCIASALQHAAYIYTLNNYLGCLAYEYVYTKANQKANAENWYKQSLISALPNNMLWQDIKYNKTVQTSLKIVGNFNNWKTQNMYENSFGTYSRRVMTPKCEGCQYKVIVDYQKNDVPSKSEFVVAG